MQSMEEKIIHNGVRGMTDNEIREEFTKITHSLAKIRRQIVEDGKHWHKSPYTAYHFAQVQDRVNSTSTSVNNLEIALLALRRENEKVEK